MRIFIKYFILTISIFIATYVTIGFSLSSPSYLGPVSEYYDGESFRNIYPPTKTDSIFKRLSTNLQFKSSRNLTAVFPIKESQFVSVTNNIKVTHINHSSWLLQYQDMTIIIDPIFSDRASPLQFIGPKRTHEPPFSLTDTPHIDIIFVSNNHYDKMDKTTLKYLISRDNPVCISGLGTHLLLNQWGCETVVGLNWFETLAFNEDFSFTFTPSHDSSGRGLLDKNNSLWGGLLIEYKKQHTTYYTGDVSNSELFDFLTKQLSPIQLLILPQLDTVSNHEISSQLMTTSKAVLFHNQLNSQQTLTPSLATFTPSNLSLSNIHEDLAVKKSIYNILDTSFLTMISGQQIIHEISSMKMIEN